MITLENAINALIEHRPARSVTMQSLDKALGTHCAHDIIAKVTLPPFKASAMDGYAICGDDAYDGAELDVIGQAPAGKAFEGIVSKGMAVRIFTGAAVPKGAETIVIQENVAPISSAKPKPCIKIITAPPKDNAIRKAGIDFRKDDVLIAKNTRLTPAHIALAAAANYEKVPIYKPLKVALIANGDELRPPGSALKDGQIISSNSAALGALIRLWGGEPLDMGIAADNIEAICDHINAAKEADIIIPIGGASVGDYDYMQRAFTQLGYDPVFSKIAVKPGKPTWFGRLGSQSVLGLPGNPASANVCAHLCLKILMRLSDRLEFIDARLDAPIAKNGPRESYQRGRLYRGRNAAINARIFPRQDSSLITPLAQANALIQLPALGGPWQAGDIVKALPLGYGPDIFQIDADL